MWNPTCGFVQKYTGNLPYLMPMWDSSYNPGQQSTGHQSYTAQQSTGHQPDYYWEEHK